MGGARQHAGVAVQRHHIGKASPQRPRRAALGGEGRRAAEEQPVQVLQRAALAVPAHPAHVGLQQRARSVEVEVLLPPRAGVHLSDAGVDGGEDVIVSGHVLAVGVGEVAQQQTAQVRVVLQRPQRLQVVAHGPGPASVGDGHRGDDQGTAALRQAVQLQLQKPRGSHAPRKHAPRQREGRRPPHRQAQGQKPGREQAARQRRERRAQHDEGEGGPLSAGIGHPALQPQAGHAEGAAQRPPSRVVIEPPAHRGPGIVRIRDLAHLGHCAPGHGHLVQA